MLQVFHGTDLTFLRYFVEKLPEEISFADGACIPAVPGDDWDGGVAVVTHFFQTLTECIVIIEVGNTAFGEQKISNVHFAASFLDCGGAALFGLHFPNLTIQERLGNLVNNL